MKEEYDKDSQKQDRIYGFVNVISNSINIDNKLNKSSKVDDYRWLLYAVVFVICSFIICYIVKVIVLYTRQKQKNMSTIPLVSKMDNNDTTSSKQNSTEYKIGKRPTGTDNSSYFTQGEERRCGMKDIECQKSALSAGALDFPLVIDRSTNDSQQPNVEEVTNCLDQIVLAVEQVKRNQNLIRSGPARKEEIKANLEASMADIVKSSEEVGHKLKLMEETIEKEEHVYNACEALRVKKSQHAALSKRFADIMGAYKSTETQMKHKPEITGNCDTKIECMPESACKCNENANKPELNHQGEVLTDAIFLKSLVDLLETRFQAVAAEAASKASLDLGIIPKGIEFQKKFKWFDVYERKFAIDRNISFNLDQLPGGDLDKKTFVKFLSDLLGVGMENLFIRKQCQMFKICQNKKNVNSAYRSHSSLMSCPEANELYDEVIFLKKSHKF